MTVVRLRAGCAAAVLLTCLAACSGTDQAPAPTPTPGPVQSGGGGISPADLPTPPALSDPQGAVADVTVGECPLTAGSPTVSGTVKNSSRDDADYVIVINWTNDTYDVAGRGVAVVEDLEAGKTAEWKLDGKVGPGATRCTPNVQRGRLGS